MHSMNLSNAKDEDKKIWFRQFKTYSQSSSMLSGVGVQTIIFLKTDQ